MAVKEVYSAGRARTAHLAVKALLLVASLLPVSRAEVPQPPLEAYGNLPGVRMMQISPDERTLAFVRHSESGLPLLLVYDIDKGTRGGGVDIRDVKPRTLYFADNDYVILVVSETIGLDFNRFRIEYSGAYSYSRQTTKVRKLLRPNSDLQVLGGVVGRVVGKAPDSAHVFMPAYVRNRRGGARYSLLKVDLGSDRGGVISKGTNYTTDWFVDSAGRILAREDYNNKSDLYSISRLED